MKENCRVDTRFIHIKGAREHNLKNISVKIPIGKITVVTGDSGSGKSSLVFDVLYAEVRRKYLAAVSPAGQLLGAPNVDQVEPALAAAALTQNWFNRNPHSSVSTVTGISKILRSIFHLAGEVYCPSCGSKIHQKTSNQLKEELKYLESGTKIIVKSFVGRASLTEPSEIYEKLMQYERQGFLRCEIDGNVRYLEELTPKKEDLRGDVFIVVDRLIKKRGVETRLSDSLRQASELGDGFVWVEVMGSRKGAGGPGEKRIIRYSESPACFNCGLGLFQSRLPDETLGVTEALVKKVSGLSFKEASAVAIDELVSYVEDWLKAWKGETRPEFKAALLAGLEVIDRLKMFQEMGLGYLRLDSKIPFLSSGERRKLQTAALLFQKMAGILFVLDEPLAGLLETERRIIRERIKELKEQGNTVVVVEHDKALLEDYADWHIKIGPGAGETGGRLLYQGEPGGADFARTDSVNTTLVFDHKIHGDLEHVNVSSWTGGVSRVKVPLERIRNLKEETIRLPLRGITTIFGPSGSGKSALALSIYKSLKMRIHGEKSLGVMDEKHCGGKEKAPLITGIRFMDEILPQGSVSSLIATYMGIYGQIAGLLSRTPEARARGITRTYVSLSRKGGRCEKCKGTGRLVLEPEFLQPVEYRCDACNGKRFSEDVLSVKYRGASLSDMLEKTVSQAATFFRNIQKVRQPLEALERIGLGYLRLGQAVCSLSGGERQRLKLASILTKRSTGRELIILDNVSRGLSERDMIKLLRLFKELVDAGHCLILVDNHKILLENCSWLIKMGPGSGPNGGRMVSQKPLLGTT